MKQVERGELAAESFMGQIADMSRTLVKEHTAPEERFSGLFPDAKETEVRLSAPAPAAAEPYMRVKKDSFVITGTVLLRCGKTINSFPARKNP